MQINIVSGNATLNVVQNIGRVNNNITDKEKAERHIRVLKRHLESNDVDDETRKEFYRELEEAENKLKEIVK